MKYLVILFVGLLVFNCKERESKTRTANDIINTAIGVSGVKSLDASNIEFDFRDVHYKAERSADKFEYMRITKDSINETKDILNNTGFRRYVNDSLITVPDSMATKYSASVNSVHYFAVLPYGLDGKAVNKTYVDSIKLKGQSYHKIKVTFNKDGGGEDFEDVFIYWVNQETSQVDYLAYSYNEDEGLGLRFREAYNERFTKGVRFVDYNNYKPKDNTANLEDLDQLFIEDRLDLLSKIELKNVIVN